MEKFRNPSSLEKRRESSRFEWSLRDEGERKYIVYWRGGGRFKGERERERERVRKNGSVLTLRLWKIWEDELRLDKFWGRKGEWRFEEFESALNYEDIGNIFEFALKFTMGQNNVGLDCG